MKWNYQKGINKQYLMRSDKRPPDVARFKSQEMVYDWNEIRCFVDASELNFHGIFGLGVCVVGQDQVIVKSKKHYNQSMKGQIVYAELMSIIFGIEELGNLLECKEVIPTNIIVFSDLKLADKILIEDRELTKNKTINLAVKKTKKLGEELSSRYANISLQVQFMKEKVKKFNPYYKAAHNAARKSIGL